MDVLGFFPQQMRVRVGDTVTWKQNSDAGHTISFVGAFPGNGGANIFTIPGNLSGIPGVSVPCGFSVAGLPIGLQVLGRPLDEARVLRAAYAYEQATPWRGRRPDLT